MYRVTLANSGDFSFSASSKSHQFSIDMKGEKGISPLDTLLASLGSCIGVYIRKYAEGAKINIPEFTVNVNAELSGESPLRFKEIEVAIDLQGANIEECRLNAMLEFIKRCPVHNTLKNSPQVQIKIN
jgi:uncharacterized OsmC-like protein